MLDCVFGGSGLDQSWGKTVPLVKRALATSPLEAGVMRLRQLPRPYHNQVITKFEMQKSNPDASDEALT